MSILCAYMDHWMCKLLSLPPVAKVLSRRQGPVQERLSQLEGERKTATQSREETERRSKTELDNLWSAGETIKLATQHISRSAQNSPDSHGRPSTFYYSLLICCLSLSVRSSLDLTQCLLLCVNNHIHRTLCMQKPTPTTDFQNSSIDC